MTQRGKNVSLNSVFSSMSIYSTSLCFSFLIGSYLRTISSVLLIFWTENWRVGLVGFFPKLRKVILLSKDELGPKKVWNSLWGVLVIRTLIFNCKGLKFEPVKHVKFVSLRDRFDFIQMVSKIYDIRALKVRTTPKADLR